MISGEKEEDHNPILSQRFFTNIYREADTGTKYLRRKILDKFFKENNSAGFSRRETAEIVFMTVVYRLVNRIETFEEFGEDWGLVNHHRLMEYLEERKEEGKAVFTQAHNTMGRERLRVLVEELVLRIDVITEEILMAQTLEQCVDLFRTFSNIENFFSWQITCDLLELDIIQMEENSWVVLGPGARAGLRRVFTSVVTREEELHYTKLLVRILPYCFKTLDLTFVTFLERRLSLKHVEHALCEWEKYWRQAAGESQAGRLYYRRNITNTRLCALCDSQQDLQLTVSPWLLCGRCLRFEERKGRNSAASFAWEEVRERFKLKNLSVNLKDLRITKSTS